MRNKARACDACCPITRARRIHCPITSVTRTLSFRAQRELWYNWDWLGNFSKNFNTLFDTYVHRQKDKVFSWEIRLSNVTSERDDIMRLAQSLHHTYFQSWHFERFTFISYPAKSKSKSEINFLACVMSSLIFLIANNHRHDFDRNSVIQESKGVYQKTDKVLASKSNSSLGIHRGFIKSQYRWPTAVCSGLPAGSRFWVSPHGACSRLIYHCHPLIKSGSMKLLHSSDWLFIIKPLPHPPLYSS